MTERLRFKVLEQLFRFHWWCEWILENTPVRTYRTIAYEPISTATLISIIIAGASFGANLLISHLMRPKMKPQVRGKLTGDFTLSDSIFGWPIPRIYGKRPADDEPGGVEAGCNFIWMSDIRKTETQTPGGGGGGGGKGGGGGNSQPNIEVTYKVDIAGIVGEGRLKLLRMKWNEDTVYSLIGGSVVGGGAMKTRFEAEDPDNDLAGGASIVSDTDCSNDEKVTGIGLGGSLTFNILNIWDTSSPSMIDPGDDPPPIVPFLRFDIQYKSSGDTNCSVLLNGTGGLYAFPDSGGLVARKTVLRAATDLGDFTLEFSNPDAAGPDIDCMDISVEYHAFGEGGGGTGIKNDILPAESAQDNVLLPDPKNVDTQAGERYNGVPDAPSSGYQEIALANGASLAWYQGTEDQPIDAVIDANITSVYGAGSTPAFLGTAYFRIQNLDFTKYGSIPAVRVVVENADLGTVEEILLHEGTHGGASGALAEEDLDLTAAVGKNIRGYYIADVQEPAKAFEDLGYVHNLNFAESHSGVVKAIDLSDRTVIAELTADDLGAYIADGDSEPPIDDVVSIVPEESEDLIRSLELQFNNPLLPSDFSSDRRAFNFPFTDSQKKESKAVNVTLTPEEAAVIVRRDLQTRHLKQAPDQVVIPHAFAYLDAGNVITIPVGGAAAKRRIEDKNGSVPGVYELTLTNEDIYVIADDGAIVESHVTPAGKKIPQSLPVFPANSVGTIMDIPPILDAHRGIPGVYVAACSKGVGAWRGCQVLRLKGGAWEPMNALTKQAGIGRTVDAMPAPEGSTLLGPLGIDSAGEGRTVIVEFFGDFNPTTVTDDEADDGANPYLVGDEVCIIKDWTRDTDYPNRWTGTVKYSGVKNTDSFTDTHEIGERVVYLNDAVKFVPLDLTEVAVNRTWKFVTYGADIEATAPIDFNWQGHSLSWMVADVTSSRELLLSEAGKLIRCDTDFSGTDMDLTLPLTTNCVPNVTKFSIQDKGSHTLTIQVNNSGFETIEYLRSVSGSITGVAGATSFRPERYATVEILYKGFSTWVVTGGPIKN